MVFSPSSHRTTRIAAARKKGCISGSLSLIGALDAVFTNNWQASSATGFAACALTMETCVEELEESNSFGPHVHMYDADSTAMALNLLA